jgi:hypothetical protein
VFVFLILQKISFCLKNWNDEMHEIPKKTEFDQFSLFDILPDLLNFAFKSLIYEGLKGKD